MEAKEIRIGNLIQSRIPLYGSWAGRQRFDKEIYIVGADTFQNDIEKYFTGIPLTEDWLLKMGFVQDLKYTDFFAPDDIGMMISKKDDLYGIRFSLDVSVTGIFNLFESEPISIIKYVHQLQNIYYALTGTELTIK